MSLRYRFVGSVIVSLTALIGLTGCGTSDSANAPKKSSVPMENAGPDTVGDAQKGAKGTKDNPTADSDSAPPQESAEEVDLSEMLAEFKADEAAAKQKWVGKRVKFSGWSGTFNTDSVPYGMPIFLCVNAEKVSSLAEVISTPRIYVDLQGNPWDTFNVFQPVVVEGTVVYDSVFKIKDGNVTAPEGEPSPRVTVEELAAEAEKDFEAAKEKYEARWLTLSGKVLEHTSVNPESDLSNGLLIFYRSENVIIQAEFSHGSNALSKIKAGDTIVLGDEVDFVGPLFEQPSVIHFSLPMLITEK